jgi:membrane peptidoglycan carboxypeptidase
MFRFVHPDGTVDELDEFLREHLRSTNLSLTLVEQLYQEFVPGRYDINDQGYLARVHPLELWLVRYLTHHPNATLTAASEASAEARQQVYKWLFSPKLRRAQDTRIRNLIETEAFHQIHKQWKRTGYPFSSMVPSLASSIGSSGDRPAALAELVGIILNDGVRLPLVRLEELHFGANTPYETLLRRDGSTLNQAERVLKSEVARRLRKAMVSVVERGTARRVFGAYKRSDGASYVIGGKTGTGDHRHESYGPGGRLIASRVVNRTATFAFFIGDRFFGVISAHVPGADAAKFHFTSALAAELLKIVSPSLAPILEQQENGLTPILDPRDPPPGSATPPTKGSAAAKPKETTPPPTPKTAATSAAVKPTARAANSPAKVAQEPERVAAPPKVVPPTAPPPSVAKQPKTAAPSLPIIIPPPL